MATDIMAKPISDSLFFSLEKGDWVEARGGEKGAIQHFARFTGKKWVKASRKNATGVYIDVPGGAGGYTHKSSLVAHVSAPSFKRGRYGVDTTYEGKTPEVKLLAAPKPTPEAKEPWKMTRAEFVGLSKTRHGEPAKHMANTDLDELRATRPEGELKKIDALIEQEHKPLIVGKKGVEWQPIYSPENEHKAYVKLALSEGHSVPAEVLKDYPELGKEEELPGQFKVLGRGPSGEANVWKAANGEIIERVQKGEKKGWYRTQVGSTEFVGKTPERALEMATEWRNKEPFKGKEGWQVTRKDWMSAYLAGHKVPWPAGIAGEPTGEIGRVGDPHWAMVERALKAGKPVPKEVLGHYERNNPEWVKAVRPEPKAESKGQQRAKYNRGSWADAVRAAKALKADHNLYLFPTYEGIKIEKQAPPFGLQHIIVKPDGTYQRVNFEFGKASDPPGMQVGHQSGSLGVPPKVHTQKSTGKAVTASMESFAKLQEARKEAAPVIKKAEQAKDVLGTLSYEDASELLAGLDLRVNDLDRRIDEGKANLESIKESLDPRIAKLTPLIPTTKEGRSEITHITKGQYRKVWGKEPPTSIVSGGKVRWEYALDTIAQELHLEGKAQTEGKHPEEYLKGLIEDAKDTKELIRATEAEIHSDESTLKALDKLKDTIKARTAKTTAGPLLQKLAKAPKVKATTKPKPETKAKAIVAGVAQALIQRIQAKRGARAVAIDRSLLAVKVVPISKAELWAKNPNRMDIRGVDTPGSGRVTSRTGFADKGKTRMSRKHHRGWKRIKL